MEINDNHIIDLIKGQAEMKRGLEDLKSSVDKGFTFIHSENKELDARVSKVEKKVWYFSGIGTILGMVAGFFGSSINIKH